MKLIKSYIIFICTLVSFTFLILQCSVVTRPSEYKVIRQFGGVKRVIDKHGLSFKIPIIQSVESIPKYKMCYDLAPSNITTSDKKILVVDSFAIWDIQDPLKYITSISADMLIAQNRLNNSIYNSVNTVMPSMTQDTIISGRDGLLADSITDGVGNKLDEYGIRLHHVETKMIDLPEDNKAMVFERMITERNSISASYESQGKSKAEKIKNDTNHTVKTKLAEANAKAEQIKAEGEAEYMNILSSAYSDESKAEFYRFIRGMDTLKSTLVGTNKTIILDNNSEIAKLLIGD